MGLLPGLGMSVLNRAETPRPSALATPCACSPSLHVSVPYRPLGLSLRKAGPLGMSREEQPSVPSSRVPLSSVVRAVSQAETREAVGVGPQRPGLPRRCSWGQRPSVWKPTSSEADAAPAAPGGAFTCWSALSPLVAGKRLRGNTTRGSHTEVCEVCTFPALPELSKELS